MKENIENYDDGWGIVKKVSAKKFTWKENPERGVVEGFIAHEVSEAGLKNAVIGEKDAVNEDGSMKTQWLEHWPFVPTLWSALQRAIADIEMLQSKVNELEQQMKEVKSKL